MAVQWGITNEQNTKRGASSLGADCRRLSPSGMSGASPDGLKGDDETTRMLQVRAPNSLAEQGHHVANTRIPTSHRQADLLSLPLLL